MNFEEACRHLNIPSDRMALVKRNVELAAKLRAALNALDAFGEAWHRGKQHHGDYSSCKGDICAGMSKTVASIKADK